jgi:L-iditol 2-dehydrogenase
MELELGALVEPLSVAIHASRRARLKEDEASRGSVLVFGAGAVGLLVAAVCKLDGVKKVIIADIDEGRVEFATRNGFAHQGFVVPLLRGKDIDESLDIAKKTAAEIGKLVGDNGKAAGDIDAVFECTGVSSCLQAAIYVRSIPSTIPNMPSHL